MVYRALHLDVTHQQGCQVSNTTLQWTISYSACVVLLHMNYVNPFLISKYDSTGHVCIYL